MLKKLTASLICCLAAISPAMDRMDALPLIPQPLEVVRNSGSIELYGVPTIAVSDASLKVQAKILEGFFSGVLEGNDSALKVNLVLDKNLAKEEYILEIDGSINISGGSPTGVYYGAVTLSQLLPTAKSSALVNLPKLKIQDKPRFDYRGTMVDVSRHFIAFDEMKKYIDIISRHKMNTLQLHLTDNEGWRLEIEAYPKLTEEGSVRGTNHKVKPFRHRSTSNKQVVDADPYGPFFYTKKQMRELITYASERGVSIVPEIDLPGHSKAVAATMGIACKTDSADSGLHGYAGNVWCASRESNFVMIETILKEVAELFPSDYIHFGGDEVNVKQWPKCPDCRKMMEIKGLKSGHAVQNYFVKRVTDIITRLGKKPVGWNEILHGGQLPKETAVMSWIGTGPGISAAKQGYDVIMAPGQYLYFDMKESSNANELGHWWAGIVTLEKAHSYNAVDGIPAKYHKNIKGISSALWTEFVSPEKTQFWYKSFPRLCATAEAAWRPSSASLEYDSIYSYRSFMQRMATGHLNRLDAWGIPYRIPRAMAYRNQNGTLEIEKPHADFVVRYTTDGSEPTSSSPKYSGGLLKKDSKLKYLTFAPSGRQAAFANHEVTRRPAGQWQENGTVRVPMGEYAGKPGFYLVELRRTGGHALKLTGEVSGFESGVVLEKDAAGHVNMVKRVRNARIIIEVPEGFDDKAIVLKAEGQVNSKGLIYVSPIGGIHRGLVRSELKVAGKSSVKYMADGNKDTWTTFTKQKLSGKSITIIYEKPVVASSLTVISGAPRSSTNFIQKAKVELSEDGKTFTAFEPKFNLGKATVKTNAKKVTAVRITFTAEHDEAVTLQDINFR